MNCHQAQERFADVLFGELPAEEQAALAAHVEACDDCRGQMLALAAARNSLTLIDAGEPAMRETPAAFAASLYRAVSLRQQRRGRRWRTAALWLGGVAAVVLVVALTGVRLELDSSRLVISWRDAPAKEAVAFADPWPELARQQRRLNEVNELFHLVVAELDSAEGRQAAALNDLKRDQRLALAELARRVDMLRGGHRLSGLQLAALQGDVQKLEQFLTVFASAKTE